MKRLFTYCLLLLLNSLAFAQPAGWEFNAKTRQKTFSFKKNDLFQIDGTTLSLSAGDYVGIFTKVNKIEKCVGYATVTSDTFDLKVPAHGQIYSADTTGYVFNSTFRIRWWSKNRDCQTVVDYTDSSDSAYRLDSNAKPITIKKIATQNPSIVYSNSIYYVKKDADPSPIKSGFIPDLRFRSSSPRLALDSILGTIYLQYSPTDTYTITFHSQYCLRTNSIEVMLRDTTRTIIDTSKAPILTNLVFDLLSPGCKTLGSIHFQENTILGKKPFVFQLSTSYSPDVISNTNGKFDELREGNYQLTVRDSTSKETKYGKTISLAKQGDCTSSVLAPNSKDGLQAIFIPETGTANILNRDGAVIKKLTIPAEWDGRDANGNDVPMGDYYLFINEQQSKVITVIR